MRSLSRWWTICLAIWGFGFAANVGLTADSSAEKEPVFDDSALEFFEKEVRPILTSRCVECHGGGQGDPKGGLTLTSRSGAIKGGDTGPAVVPSKPKESLLVSAIEYGDLYQMPPKSKLPAKEIATLTKWVEMGAPWPKDKGTAAGTVKPFDLTSRKAEHWCWHPIADPPVPAVKNQDWPLSNADRFILANLEAKGLTPASPAEKHTLLRRVTFDLIGLPPSPDEVAAFVNDSSPQAFERVVDRLLQSVHFGERWGRHWLDLVRYAETRGHEFEPIIPNAWQFRDYVIRALNADVSYDRLLMEHVAGDLIEPRWRQPIVAESKKINEGVLGTGFWFLGEEVHSPVDIRKDETDRMDNRLDVMSKTFLGLTVSCARCHDHKFDAISQRDYYALTGYLLSGSYRQVRVQTQENDRQVAAGLEEIRTTARREVATLLQAATRPILDKVDQYFLTAHQATVAEAPTRQQVDSLAESNKLAAGVLWDWCAELIAAKSDKKHPLHGTVSQLPVPSSQAAVEAPAGLVINFGLARPADLIQDGVSFGDAPSHVGQLQFDNKPGLRVTTLGGWERDLFWKDQKLVAGTEDDHATMGAWHRHGRMVRTPEFTLTKDRLWYLVRGTVRAYATVNSHLVVAGPLHGSLLREFKHTDDQWHWVSHSLELYRGHRLHVEFSPDDNNECRIAMVVQSNDAPKLPELSIALPAGETIAQRAAILKEQIASAFSLASGLVNPSQVSTSQAVLADWCVQHLQLFASTDDRTAINRRLEQLRHDEDVLAKQVQWESQLAPAMLEGNGVDELLLIRGNSNTPRDPVDRRFLEALGGMPQPGTAGSGRLELAQQMLRSPLVARVAVNRIWYHLFGRGIVPSVDNMGVLGQAPTHPELLDHLATQFVKDGWSTKRMIKSLLLSRTYQMSSRPSDLAESADPDNLLWHRMPIKRLEGEIIRDSLLAVSGRLDPTTFGPSVPIHLTPFMEGRGRPGVSGPVDGNGRRSIYIAVRRNFLSPMMLAFDTPSPFSTVGRRTTSNVPAQALILMNDPLVINMAKLWAEKTLSGSPRSADERIDGLYQTAFARKPTLEERADALKFLDDQATRFGVPPEQRLSSPQAWADLCHVLFNLKEFVFVE